MDFPLHNIHTAYIGEYLHFRYLKCLVIRVIHFPMVEFIAQELPQTNSSSKRRARHIPYPSAFTNTRSVFAGVFCCCFRLSGRVVWGLFAFFFLEFKICICFCCTRHLGVRSIALNYICKLSFFLKTLSGNQIHPYIKSYGTLIWKS